MKENERLNERMNERRLLLKENERFEKRKIKILQISNERRLMLKENEK